MTSGSRPPNDTTLTLLLGLVATAVVLDGILRIALLATTALQRLDYQPVASGTALRVLASLLDPGPALGTPDVNAMVFWTLACGLLGLLGGLLVAVRRAILGRDAPADPQRLPGIASSREIATAASGRALRRRAGTLRPSLDRPTPADVGYLLGTARSRQVWATVEDSILLIGPPRSGKGLHVVINAILDAPGPVITTSTRPDNLTATITARQAVGPVAIFDPQQLAPGLPAGLRWSPIRGCDTPLTAMIRATALASSTGLAGGAVDNGGFWEGKTRTAIQTLLHAAALGELDAVTLYQWALNPAAAADAVRILQSTPDAATGWAESLDAMISADPRTRDSIWQGVSLAFSALADPRVLDAVSPTSADAFDPEAFLRANGTLYLLATGTGAGASASLVAALIEDLIETARTLAARSTGARLDPPLLLALDEIGNLAPLPSLPTLMADGGGTGITTMPVLQSLAQARTKWGDHAATAIWDAAITKIILGGASGSRDLQDLSTLIGDRDDHTQTTSIDATGARSTQQALRRIPIMSPATIRTLPFGTAVTLLRTTRPIITQLRPWTARRDAPELQRERDQIEANLQSS